MSLLVELLVKSALLAGSCLLATRVLKDRSSSEKAAITAAGLVATALLPLLMHRTAPVALQLPAWQPGPALVAFAHYGMLAATSGLVFAAYLAGAGLLLLAGVRDVWNLAQLRRRAEPVRQEVWLDALARHARKLGIRRPLELKVSHEIRSPVSWGLARPIVLIDHATLGTANVAELVIAHELAHVARLDWLWLLLRRIVWVLLWFDPFVWLLSRANAHFCEQAADDLALQAGAGGPDYAAMLLTLARRAARMSNPLANSALQRESWLGRRVRAVLDTRRSRSPARLGFVIVVAALISSGAAVLAALTLETPGAARTFTRVDGVPPHPELAQIDATAWDWAVACRDRQTACVDKRTARP